MIVSANSTAITTGNASALPCLIGILIDIWTSNLSVENQNSQTQCLRLLGTSFLQDEKFGETILLSCSSAKRSSRGTGKNGSSSLAKSCENNHDCHTITSCCNDSTTTNWTAVDEDVKKDFKCMATSANLKRLKKFQKILCSITNHLKGKALQQGLSHLKQSLKNLNQLTNCSNLTPLSKEQDYIEQRLENAFRHFKKVLLRLQKANRQTKMLEGMALRKQFYPLLSNGTKQVTLAMEKTNSARLKALCNPNESILFIEEAFKAVKGAKAQVENMMLKVDVVITVLHIKQPELNKESFAYDNATEENATEKAISNVKKPIVKVNASTVSMTADKQNKESIADDDQAEQRNSVENDLRNLQRKKESINVTTTTEVLQVTVNSSIIMSEETSYKLTQPISTRVAPLKFDGKLINSSKRNPDSLNSAINKTLAAQGNSSHAISYVETPMNVNLLTGLVTVNEQNKESIADDDPAEQRTSVANDLTNLQRTKEFVKATTTIEVHQRILNKTLAAQGNLSHTTTTETTTVTTDKDSKHSPSPNFVRRKQGNYAPVVWFSITLIFINVMGILCYLQHQ